VTTGQYGAVWAQQDLRRILGIAGARVVDGDLPVSRAASVFNDSGNLTDELVAGRLRERLVALAGAVSADLLVAAA
jgi:chromate reductase